MINNTFDYTRKPKKSDILVSVIIESDHDYYIGLFDEIKHHCDKFDITCKKYDEINAAEYQNCMIKHAIVITEESNVDIATKKYASVLQAYGCMSLGLSYRTEQDMLSQREMVDHYKELYAGKINYLRPDLMQGELPLISRQKIADNAVCDTIRIKYDPNCIPEKTVDLSIDETRYFTHMSLLIKKYHLYHRSLTDGFIALRRGNDFLVTCTKTKKYPLDLRRISLVKDYHRESNRLDYIGTYLPSSDVVEASEVFKHNPHITALVHTHASEHFTRNKNYQHKIAVARGSYGIPELGDEINNVIDKFNDDFLILDEHGELFALTGDVSQNCKTMGAICRREIQVEQESAANAEY